MVSNQFWKNKRVLVTGHTGFKGSWLTLWLKKLGAAVAGYSLEPPTNPSLFELINLQNEIKSIIGDIRDFKKLCEVIDAVQPEIIFHLAAQPLVRESYKEPRLTYETNIMGTVNLLEAIRLNAKVRVLVNVTSDKCYENLNDGKSRVFKETDPLGGYDPYSSSKAGSEIVTAAYRRSFLSPGTAVATARAGNVIGGGDWAQDRLVPDFVRAILKKEILVLRNPQSVRPWQHVLEPLSGYLLLAEKLMTEGKKFEGSWNFGPEAKDAKSVEWIVKKLAADWGPEAKYRIDSEKHPHEAQLLQLDISKAKKQLGWRPKWSLETALQKVVEWTRGYLGKQDLKEICLRRIQEYSEEKA